MHHFPINIRHTEISALVPVRQSLVIDTHLMQDDILSTAFRIHWRRPVGALAPKSHESIILLAAAARQKKIHPVCGFC